MVVKIIYILYHVLSPFLKTNLKYFYIIFSCISIIIIYLLKEDTYDIIAYTQAVNYPFIFEIGYAILSYTIHLFVQNERLTVLIIQLILSTLFFSLIFQIKNKKDFLNFIIYILLIVSSLAFTLGVNNVLRQAFASIFIIWAFFLLHNKKYISSIFLVFLSVLFHKSSLLFYLFILESSLIIEFFFKKKIYIPSKELKKYLSLGSIIFLQSFAIIIVLILLYLLLIHGFYSEYAKNTLGLENGTRKPLYIKVFFIIIVFLLSEYFLGNYKRINLFFEKIRFLRLSLLILLILLSFNINFNELGSRVMYYYYVVELLFMLKAWEYNYKWSTILVLFFYGFALNALHILGGS